jgi:hypothetical protein
MAGHLALTAIISRNRASSSWVQTFRTPPIVAKPFELVGISPATDATVADTLRAC